MIILIVDFEKKEINLFFIFFSFCLRGPAHGALPVPPRDKEGNINNTSL